VPASCFGESKIEEQLERATERANKLTEKQIDADAEDVNRVIRRRRDALAWTSSHRLLRQPVGLEGRATGRILAAAPPIQVGRAAG
jgi:hypothetical protein